MKKLIDVDITVVTLRDRASSEDDVKKLWSMMGCAAIHWYKKHPKKIILSGKWPRKKIKAALQENRFTRKVTTWDDLKL